MKFILDVDTTVLLLKTMKGVGNIEGVRPGDTHTYLLGGWQHRNNKDEAHEHTSS